MVIFLDEEHGYLSWIGHHRDAYVIEGLRRPTRKAPTLHRAECSQIRSAGSKRTHWTTGRRLKACASDRDELIAWSEREYGQPPVECPQCHPSSQQPLAPLPPAERDHSLTPLAKEIVDFVVEAAVIQLDREEPDYDLTIGGLATALDKTPGQITSTLLHLVENGYLRIAGNSVSGRALPKGRGVFPTAAALRTLPAFTELSRRAIEKELGRLSADG